MIKASHLTKRYGKTVALDDVSFQIGRGELVGVVGPNGAGKTTLLRVLAGTLAPSAGTAHIGGHDVLADPLAVHQKIAYLPERTALYKEMRVREFLRFRAALKGLDHRESRKRLIEAVHRTALEGLERALLGGLSAGEARRVMLADCLLGNPAVLILDEPTLGLDPVQTVRIRQLLAGLAGKHTVLMTTHVLDEARGLCERILVLNAGRLTADGTFAKLAAPVQRGAAWIVELRGPEAAVLTACREIPGVDAVSGRWEGDWGRCRLVGDPEADLNSAVLALAVARHWEVRDLRSEADPLAALLGATKRREGGP